MAMSATQIWPDTDLLFPPYSSFIRELYNNATSLRQLTKPRHDGQEKQKKLARKKPAMKKPAKKKPAKKKPAKK